MARKKITEDTIDITEQLAENARIEAAYDASMRELTLSQFNALTNEANTAADVETYEQAMAWLAINGEAACKAEAPERIETADEKWVRGVTNAVTKLEGFGFELSQTASLILQRACENVASNKGFAPRPPNGPSPRSY